MARLVIVVDGQETAHELQDGETLIGRHPDCAVAISQPSVSGKHAKIHSEGGVFAVEDVGSRNGTYVNQQRIQGRVTLKHNVALRFGDGHARFEDPAMKPTAGPRSSWPTVADLQRSTLELGPAQVHIDEAGEATITGQRALKGPAEAEQLGKLLLEDVRRHARGCPQSDDITIMTFGRDP